MNQYGIENTHRALYERLYEYISSQYFGASTLLQNAVLPQLKKEDVLYKEPYIEANNAYETVCNGIEKADLPIHIRNFMHKLIEKKLGVFENPFSHQVKALESFFQDKDLFVATGTGSGKTECFMWPMIASIGNEVYLRKRTWEMRGVRALFLYPMNALVSDQVGRLRKILGDVNGDFRSILRNTAKDNEIRMPQFGMYTGRTPYPGEQNVSKDKALAKAISKDIINISEDTKKELIRLGKYPAKIDLKSFVDGLNNGEHITDKNDSELITRLEMQKYCPDILITNYSMLEYMLMRERESTIWEDTKVWLNASDDNKLLFVIDEAHMYRGSAGGEVALLIKRVMHKLEINENKIRFILTSASMPHGTEEDKQSIIKFASDFTSRSNSKSFELIFGNNEKLPDDANLDVNPEEIYNISIDSLQGLEDEKLASINEFCTKVFKKEFKFDNSKVACDWLYNNLLRTKQGKLLLENCRGNAVAFKALSEILFPKVETNKAKTATQVFLAIATLAKEKQGKVLFPSRVHMFFRGIKGVYACTNPNCNEEKNSYDGVSIGKIYFDSVKDTCKCGGKIYEIINHRRCGALFIKGYIDESINGNLFIWQRAGVVKSDTLKEIHLFIANEEVNNAYLKKEKINAKVKWFNPITGILYDDKIDGCIKVLYSTNKKGKNKEEEIEPNTISFYRCPKCSNKIGKRGLTDFSTKGNVPFYNIVNAQLLAQPQRIFDKEKLKKFPNAGRKVLLFSDSRQRAAILARDMTIAADDNAARQALVKAVIRLQEYDGRCEKNIDMLYPVFLEVACEDNIHFFYDASEEIFIKHMEKMREKIKIYKEMGRKIKYETMESEFKNKPVLYIRQLLKLVCDNYQSLSDVALCWMEPAKSLDEVMYYLYKENIKLSEDEIKLLVSSWCISVAKDSIALGNDIDDLDDEIRREVQKNDYGRFGLKEKYNLQKGICIALEKEKGLNSSEIEKVKEIITNEFADYDKSNERKFINTSKIALKYDMNHKWYKCDKCSEVSAFALWGRCPCCGSDKLREMRKQDYETLSFWRKPVEGVIIKQNQITSINTEEHTAQLSHKDQREDTWSTTENYEMRFQDVSIDKDMPVDVLSCTTTMEVGIDIGSLSAVALRNVPPMRENYQQRAGRAGRRNSSISTITTYAHNGPHDNWYFNHPKDIIAGKVRKPWIDVESNKLVKRHLFIVLFNEFYKLRKRSIDECTTTEFFNEYFESFKCFLQKYEFTNKQKEILVPHSVDLDIKSIKNDLNNGLLKLKEDVDKHPEKYDETNEEKVTMLDSLFDEGLLPTYSFPKNVVGFYIENESGKIKEKPDRALNIAISEYAPGRTLVVNKKTYKSGGIYCHSSKYRKGEKTFINPAEAYFNDKNYFMPIYMCSDDKCDWFGTELPSNSLCPFCGKEIQSGKYMLKPWGFAPENGVSSRETEKNSDISYAEQPCYSAPPKDDLKQTKFLKLKIANRYDENITIINKGPFGAGFTVCTKCGAAIAGTDELSSKKIKSPYKMYGVCKHEKTENVVLGHTFRTDMLVLQIEIDPKKIDTTREGLWLKSATTSLAEALKLAASRVLDIEFNDIKVGFRIRYYVTEVYVDIFLYDSLSSGAGYAFRVAKCLDELFKATNDLLTNCSCESACHDCLKNFWNRRQQGILNRNEAYELLTWITKGKMANLYSVKEQKELLKPLENTMRMDDKNSKVDIQGDKIIILYKGRKRRGLVIPTMYNKCYFGSRDTDIIISDKIIRYALPKAYEIITKD